MKKIAIFFCLLFACELYAAQYATISVDRAIVYADIEMTAPIGYLVRGKRIRIGDNARNKDRVYPFILNNKVVYIEKKNISTTDDLSLISSTTQRIKEQEVKREETVIGFGPVLRLQRFSFDSGYGDMQSEVLLLTGVTLSGELNHLGTRESRILSLDFVKGNKGNQSFSEATFHFQFGYQLLQSRYLVIRPRIGLSVTPYAQYEIKNQFQKNGQGLGGNLGFDFDIRLTESWGFTLGASYNYSKYFGFELPNPYPSEFKPSLSGYEVNARVKYRF